MVKRLVSTRAGAYLILLLSLVVWIGMGLVGSGCGYSPPDVGNSVEKESDRPSDKHGGVKTSDLGTPVQLDTKWKLVDGSAVDVKWEIVEQGEKGREAALLEDPKGSGRFQVFAAKLPRKNPAQKESGETRAILRGSYTHNGRTVSREFKLRIVNE